MARQKKKTCVYCYAPLSGRRDAKTCSARCRKRLQRARLLLEHDLELRMHHDQTVQTVGLQMPKTEIAAPLVTLERTEV